MRPRAPIPTPLVGALLAAAIAGCGGPPPEPAAPPAPPRATAEAPVPEPETDDTATLDVLSGQPTEILLDGKPLGTTPITGHKIDPGYHEVTFVDPAHGDRTMSVTIEPGDAKTVQSDPAPPIMEQKPEEKE